MARDLISPKTRTEFREYLVSYTLREISDEFDSVGIPCDADYSPSVSGQRRSLVEQYYRTIDFTKPESVRKLLEVYENILISIANRPRQPWQSPGTFSQENAEQVQRLASWLKKDGYDFVAGRIVPINGAVSLGAIKAKAIAFDTAYMAQQIKRIEHAVDDDPAHAIGCAKELIETCCRTILEDRGKPVTDKPDVLPLVRRAMEELKMVPEGIPDEAKGAKTIKALLGNLATMSQSLAELRNLYGTGHGKHGRAKGLTPRHARLAVGAAATLTNFLFDAHQEKLES